MHILATNDDGIDAPGLLAMAQRLRDLGELTVLAPNRNWSASGHVKTLHRPLRVWEARLADGIHALTTDGAPSDCVALATLGLLDRPIDLVVSGINPLPNLGHDVTYSGTVTAAMEAAIAGLPGIALSLDGGDRRPEEMDFEPAARVAEAVVRRARKNGMPEGVFLNVNVPYRPWEELRGIQITRQGLRLYRDALVARKDPRGRPYYWIGGEAPSGVSEPGTDFGALQDGWVSLTPLQLDLTAADRLESFNAWQGSLA